MTQKIKSKVSVEVHRIGLREWFENTSLSFHSFLRELKFDHEMSPLDLILEREEVFLIRYYKKEKEDNNANVSHPRAFITDGEQVINFTLIDILTKLEGCYTEELHNYPQEINDVITEYCSGSGGFDISSLKEEYLKLKKYKYASLSIPFFDKEIEQNNRSGNNEERIYTNTKKELLYLSSLKFIYNQSDRGELINLNEIYWQFGEPEGMNPSNIISTPFFNQLSEKTMIDFKLQPKQLQRTKRGQLLVHEEIAWHYLTILSEDVVMKKSFWEWENDRNEPEYAIEDIDSLIENYELIFHAFHEISDSNCNTNNQKL